jgi:hypothetical protein
MNRAVGLVEEKVLVWFFNAFENTGPVVNRRTAIEDMLGEITIEIECGRYSS